MASGTRQATIFDLHEPPVDDRTIAPETGEVFSAAWDLGPTSGLIDWLTDERFEDDPTFRPDPSTLDRRFFSIYDELSEARSEGEYRAIQLREVERQDSMATIHEGGPAGVAIAVGLDIFDPVMFPFLLVPFVGQASRLGNVAKFGGVIGAEMGAREAIAHYQQPSRTADETIPIMLATTGLGMALGAVMKPSLRNVPSELTDNMVKEQAKFYKEATERTAEDVGEAVGATKATVYGAPAKLSEERVISPKVAEVLVLPNPRSRLAHSADKYGLAEPSAIGDELVRGYVPKARDEMGITPRYPNGKELPWDDEVLRVQEYLTAFSGSLNNSVRQLIKSKTGQKPSYRAVDDLTHRLYMYGDDVPIPQYLRDKIPNVDSLIKDIQPFIDDALRTRAGFTARQEAVGMFGYVRERIKDVKGNFVKKKNGQFKTRNKLDDEGNKIKVKAKDLPKYSKNHAHTVFDRNKISANPNLFAVAVAKGYKNPKRLDILGVTERRSFGELYEKRGLNAYQNITSSSKFNVGDGGGVAKHYGPPSVKPITMKVLREDIDDYIVHSLDSEFNYLGKEVEPILNGLERYGDNGLVYSDRGIEIPSLNQRMDDEFLDRRLPLAESDAPALERMKNGHAQARIDVQHIINKITGADRYLGNLDRRFGALLNELRAYTSFAWLGNVALASVHEVARSQILHGLGPMVKTMGVLINPSDLAKSNISALRAYSMGLDTTSARSTALMRADIEDPVALSGMSSFATRHVDKVYKYSGMNYMIQKFKDVEALSFLTDAVDFALKKQQPKAGSGAYKAAMRNFTRFGIGKADFKRIAKEVADGGIVRENGVWLIDADKFKSGEFLNKIRSIQASAGETSVVRGGKGAIPIILDNPIGRSMVQFKRVFFGYQGRMESLALSLSEGDMRAAGGLMTSFSLTWMAWQVRLFLKHFANDPATAAEEFEKEWAASPIQDHIYQMMERTGYTGLALHALRLTDKATKGGLSHAINTNVGSKFHRGDGTMLAGMFPSLAWTEKVLSVATSPLKEGGTTAKDLKTAASLGPMATVIYIDPILEAIAKAAGTTIDEPSKKAKSSKQGVDY